MNKKHIKRFRLHCFLFKSLCGSFFSFVNIKQVPFKGFPVTARTAKHCVTGRDPPWMVVCEYWSYSQRFHCDSMIVLLLLCKHSFRGPGVWDKTKFTDLLSYLQYKQETKHVWDLFVVGAKKSTVSFVSFFISKM